MDCIKQGDNETKVQESRQKYNTGTKTEITTRSVSRKLFLSIILEMGVSVSVNWKMYPDSTRPRNIQTGGRDNKKPTSYGAF